MNSSFAGKTNFTHLKHKFPLVDQILENKDKVNYIDGIENHCHRITSILLSHLYSDRASICYFIYLYEFVCYPEIISLYENDHSILVLYFFKILINVFA